MLGVLSLYEVIESYMAEGFPGGTSTPSTGWRSREPAARPTVSSRAAKLVPVISSTAALRLRRTAHATAAEDNRASRDPRSTSSRRAERRVIRRRPRATSCKSAAPACASPVCAQQGIFFVPRAAGRTRVRDVGEISSASWCSPCPSWAQGLHARVRAQIRDACGQGS
jgi:hypothetical protein